MSKTNSHFLVMYDITSPKVLRKVAKLLICAGFERVNYSVWIGWMDPGNEPVLNEKLFNLLAGDDAEGSLFYILPLSKSTVQKMSSINGERPKELDYWVGDRRIMFF